MIVRYPPISDYAFLSDCHSAALVSRDGSVDWCCFHRFDASPVFGRLLDWEAGGYFRVAPKDPYTVRRRYVAGTNVLETRFTTEDGSMTVLDCLALRSDNHEEPSDAHPYHQLVRAVRVEDGRVPMSLEFHPRFDYGLTVPRLELVNEHLGIVYGSADGIVLQSSIPLAQQETCRCEGEAVLTSGAEVVVAVTYSAPHELRAETIPEDELRRRVGSTIEYWQDWSDRCSYDGPYRDAVVRSALVLKGLTNGPTGAIVAAPTTSLPECVGGSRNWDYRYAWLRDAALNLYALFTLGYRDEANEFVAWLRRATGARADQLQPLYGVAGERLVPEFELEDLDGYRGSKPVRIGNAAARQLQLDVYGELLDTIWLYHRHGGEIDEVLWTFVCDVVDVVAARWSEPDEGIWEVRDDRRHFISSKAMAWVAVDRAVKLARALDRAADLDRWCSLRRDIRSFVDREGVDAHGAFVRSSGSDDLDASALLLLLVHFIDAEDPRARTTADAIESRLARNGLVYRYEGEDGLPGDEGAFAICSFWLVDNLAILGDTERACALFERLLDCRNDVGLLAEEIDPRTDEPLGNFPQAFSHVGLIGAALNLARSESRTARAG